MSERLDAATIRELLARVEAGMKVWAPTSTQSTLDLCAVARAYLELSDKVERLRLRIEEQICSCCASDIEKLNTQEGDKWRDFHSTLPQGE